MYWMPKEMKIKKRVVRIVHNEGRRIFLDATGKNQDVVHISLS